MRSADVRPLRCIWLLAALLGCGGGSSGGSPPATGRNVVAVSVVGAHCSGTTPYVNELCVSVTVCTPGTSTCQTVDDVLLDTGSYGLRVFRQALTVSLPQVASGSDALAQCVQYADLSADWGPVQTAAVVLGSEPPVQVPIQVIDSTFPGKPASCPSPELDPASAHFNGVLGVGVFAQDCGTACTLNSNVGIYYRCNGSSCSGTTVPLADQVQNPVALLPEDNNGVVVKLPAIPLGGVASAEGQVLLGIGTAANNVPAASSALALDGKAEFTTVFDGTSYTSFIDTGSNAFFFAPPASAGLPACPGNDSSWLCPANTASLTASLTGAGAGSAQVSFQITNFEALAGSGNNVFKDLGGSSLGTDLFAWGLPFFFGRSVYVGIEGRASSIGTGPYVAF